MQSTCDKLSITFIGSEFGHSTFDTKRPLVDELFSWSKYRNHATAVDLLADVSVGM